jgi:hypothetical protein
MPATSKSQQRLMAQAYGVKSGDIDPKDLNPDYKEQIIDLAKSMTLKQLKDYAETSHEDLPQKVKKESVNENSPLATASSVNGMGPLTLPVGDKPGSGDIPFPIPAKKKKTFKKFSDIIKAKS